MKALPHRLCALFLLAIFAFAVSGDKSEPQEFQISADQLAAFAGQYRYDDDPDLIWSLSVDGSRLFIESRRGARLELVPQSEDTFSLPTIRATMKFIRSRGRKYRRVQ